MIVLFTDFGPAGPYVGQMKTVIAQTAPGVPIIDLIADAPAHDPRAAAYLLAALAPGLSRGSVILAVVDPGVGGKRTPIVLEADGYRFVGPSNGLFEIVARRAQTVRSWAILWRPKYLSASFHGRDLFAPVAARLARDEPIGRLLRVHAMTRHHEWPDDLAEIIYVDHFGNAMTGLRGRQVPRSAMIAVTGRTLLHARTFGDASPGTAFWYENAIGLIEISVNRGRADSTLGLRPGMPVRVERSARNFRETRVMTTRRR
jgi:S-adenosyl-L-methionine hydrolase (adenosine-forming)